MVFYVFAYITGGLVVLLALLSYIFPKRKIALNMKFLVDAMTAINGVFIYFATNNPIIFASVATCTIGAIRNVVYLFKDRSKFIGSIWCPIIFAILAASSLIFTYKSPLSLLPAIGSVISALSIYLTNQKLVKIGAFCCYVLYLVYYLILLPTLDVLTIFAFISAAAALLSSIIGFIIILVKEKKEKEQIKENKETEL